MTSTKIITYFRINTKFVPIDTFSGQLPDKNYIEGAIACCINGREIFKIDHWDLVDQLWTYIVDGLRKLDKGQKYEGFFPDQPLRLQLETVSSKHTLVTIGNQSIKVDSASFRSTMKEGALAFFAKMKNICPEAGQTWDRYHKEASMIHT
jgi:hypothetical protein